MIAGRGNTRMRTMVRTYREARPTVRWRPQGDTVQVLEVPDEGRSTMQTQCRHCGAKYRWDIVPENCLLCNRPMTSTRRS